VTIDKPIKMFELRIVTYESIASFLVIKVLKKLAEDYSENFPVIISNDFYVNNLITGVNTLQ